MDIRETINLVEASTVPAKLETTPLPYGLGDLHPVMSKETLDYHYEHLAKAYAKKYNAGEGDPKFNRAGSFLHKKFFQSLEYLIYRYCTLYSLDDLVFHFFLE